MNQGFYRSYAMYAVLIIVFFALTFPSTLCAQMQKQTVSEDTTKVPTPKMQALPVAVYKLVDVEAVQILWPHSECESKWQARISNPSNTPIGKALAIPYQYDSVMKVWRDGEPAYFNLDLNQSRETAHTVQG
jgi:hypothetical protein